MNRQKSSKAAFHRRTAPCIGIIALALLAAGISVLSGATTTGITGGSAPFENRQPTLATRYIICLFGIFPGTGNGTPGNTNPPDRTEGFLGEIKAVPFDFVVDDWAFCEGQFLPINQNQALYNLIGTTYGGNGVTNFQLPDLRGRVPIGRGQGPGLPNYAMGQQVGTAQPSLSVANLPSHTHPLSAGNTAATGSGAAVNNLQPSLALHFLIAGNGEIMIAAWARQPHGWASCDGQLLSVDDFDYLFGHLGTTYGGDGASTFALPDLRGRAVLGDNGSSLPLGDSLGVENHVLSLSDMPAHTHTLPGGNTGSTGGPAGNLDNRQPSLVMKWLISLFGVFPSEGNSIAWPAVGEMRIIAGNTASSLSSDAWKPLDGAIYTEEESSLVFVIGDTYGGDGATNCAVPDLRSRLNISADDTLLIGGLAGEEILTISIANLAAHAHDLPAEISVEQPAGTVLVDGTGSVDFGTIGSGGGSSVKTFTITNTGVGDLLLGSITKDGSHPGDFTGGAPGATTLAPNTSTTFTVTFSPLAAGVRSAAIHIPNNDGDEGPFDIALIGTRFTHQDEWRVQHFGSSANSGAGADANDFEFDGISNYLEFATGSDPKQYSPMPGVLELVGNTLEFTYQRSKEAIEDGFTFNVKFRDHLVTGNWSSTGVTEEIISEDDDFQQVKASVTVSASKGFMRLNVSEPP